MSSHGGILGVAIFAWFYAKRNGLTWTGVGDDVVTVAPLGICFGRLANFINGELYGRATSVSWGMKFPIEGAGVGRLKGTGLEHSPEILDFAESSGFLGEFVASLTVRHPSQLYQAALEGFLIFAIIIGIRLWKKGLPDGFLTGVFFIGYALLRIFVERFREPDAQLILGVTRGQFYSGFMILAGIGFLLFALKRKKSSGS